MRIAAIVIVIAVLVVTACAPQTPPTATPTPTSQVAAPLPAAPAAPAAPAKPAWEVDWEKTVAAAKKEGKLTVYTSTGAKVRMDLQRVFSDRFGIGIEYISGRSAEVIEKVLTERRVGLYFGDICTIPPSTTLPTLKPKGALEKLDSWLILPEVTDPKYWRFEGKLRWADADHTVFPGLAYVVHGAAINTTLVRPEELQSFRDLLNPKWKGKIITDDPTTSGTGWTWWPIVGAKLMGWDFVQEVVTKQEPIVSRDWRLQLDWLARGKVAIGIATHPETTQEFIELGAPIKLIVFKEGAYGSSSNGVVSVFANAPHPNAAKLFANWFLSKEGQTVAVRSFMLPSGRLDVSTEGLDPVRIPQPGVKYIWIDQEDWLNEATPLRQKNVEIFKAVMKK